MNVHHVTFSILLDSKNKILIIKYTLSNAGEGVYIYIYIYILEFICHVKSCLLEYNTKLHSNFLSFLINSKQGQIEKKQRDIRNLYIYIFLNSYVKSNHVY